MKDALKGLLKAASEAPAGANSLAGELGLVALIEDSEHGPSRLVRILQEEKEVFWSFRVQADEDKPQFYPEDLPFLPKSLCIVTWHEEHGLSVIWSSMPGERFSTLLSEFKERIEGVELPSHFKEAAERLERSERRADPRIWEELSTLLPPSFLESFADIAHEMFGTEPPEETLTQVSTIAAFHTDAEWSLLPGPETPDVSVVRVFRKGEKQREITARHITGITSITLKETVSFDQGQ